MARIVEQPLVIEAVDNKPKLVEEFIGFFNTDNTEISIARMRSPSGWVEPGQTPEFDEYILVLKGELHVETVKGVHVVEPNQAIMIDKGEWVQYSTPSEQGAEYIAVCLPAFTPDAVNPDKL